MNYKTFISKSGTQCMLLDLMEYYDSLSDDQKSKDTATHKVCECPLCSKEGYTKHKLYIENDFSIGNCFHCHTAFFPSEKRTIKEPDKFQNPLKYFNENNKSEEEFSLIKLDGDYWNLDRYYEADLDDSIGSDYLRTRKNPYLPEIYKKLGIRFHNHNPIIPFYFHGDLFYYQLKLLQGDIKYFSPPISRKPLYIIEKSGDINNGKFVVCEGVFDAIACLFLYPDRTPAAVLGSSISPYQLWQLRSYVPRDVLVYMDDTALSKSVATKLQWNLHYADVNIVESDGTDPEEFLGSNYNR